MDSSTNVRVAKNIEVSAMVFPACECGRPYRPSKPVDHGVVFFSSKDWLSNLLWRIESFVQGLRKARMRSL